MINEYFKKQDEFLAELIEAYKQGFFIGKEYEPYFNWEITKVNNITKDDAQRLMWKVSEDLDKQYDTGNNKQIEYLEAIDSEITNILTAGLYV